MPPRVLIFLGVTLLATTLIHVVLDRRLLCRSRLSGRARHAAKLALRFASLSMLLCFVLGRFLPLGFWTRPLNWIGFTAMGGLSVLFALTLARDLLLLIRGVGRRLRRQDKRSAQGDATLAEEGPTRRAFLVGSSGGLVFGTSLVVTIAGLFRAIAKPVVEKQVVEIVGLPAALEGFSIAQISDLHIGPTLRRPWLLDVVKRVNALEADVVAVTGDLADGHVVDLRECVAPLGDLEASHGVYFVTGNHEYYWNAEEWVTEVRRLGLEVLLNEHRVLEVGGARLLLAGVTDLRAGSILPAHESDPAKARAGAGQIDTSILLAHQPRSLFAAREAGYDLQLSGHTHGGQFFPWNFVIHLLQPVVAGLRRFGDLQVYVNRGTGHWGPPLRSGAKAEITLIELKRAV